MRILPIATAALMALASPVSAQDAAYDASTVLARVNGKEITLGHMIVLFERLPDQYRNSSDDQLFQPMLDQLVDQAFLADLIEADPANDDLRTRLTLENDRRAILSNQAVNEFAAEPVGDQYIDAAYQSAYGNVEPTDEFNASHILVPTADEAVAIAQMIADGADFAETAKEKSTGPSGPDGGNLGWFTYGTMVPAFQAAVEALEVGAVSEPIQTQFGWHVIRLNDKRVKMPPTLEEVRAEIEEAARTMQVRDRLEAMRGEAVIERTGAEVPLSAIRQSELLDQ